MKCLIIDDNEIARTMLAQLVSQVDDLTVSAECSNAMEAYNFIQKDPVDLFFLDIEMPGMTGLELTRNLGDCCPVIIFTTSNKEYALEAFELNVADYLLKPVTPARFLQAVNKARDILNSQQEEVKSTGEEFIFIRDSNVIRRLSMNDILYAEALGDYVKLYTTEKMYAIHNTLKSVEERLPSDKFLRIHRSFIVALNKIDTLQDGAVVIGRKPLPVADSYRKALNRKMNVL
ncbi:LytTR family DNA-binding domain-containing protein [Ferruginibacter sp. HRS2-29]|uniref:LytR/AlgR family response regulator transcription factor n=1 Tax=Ferruginibacter sp. HRS2-29 TaxID=2487334 RepID=UPI0020CF3FF1|nr:LytTR family DNA-binding domain-containing protein [Ferruginibacter sp. HRS2-29]MCP9749740.1 DNA-binding response regulator [Ferruginibacter sp. HRS2-29]